MSKSNTSYKIKIKKQGIYLIVMFVFYVLLAYFFIVISLEYIAFQMIAKFIICASVFLFVDLCCSTYNRKIKFNIYRMKRLKEFLDILFFILRNSNKVVDSLHEAGKSIADLKEEVKEEKKKK